MRKFKQIFLTFIVFYAVSFMAFAQNPTQNTSEMAGQKWSEVKSKKKGFLTVLHYDRPPFVYQNEMGQLAGIEHDAVSEFVRYVQSKYDVHIVPQWIRSDDYKTFHESLKNSKCEGLIGLSSVRTDNELTDGVHFTAPFLKGVEVLATSHNFPTIDGTDQLKNLLDGKTAVTVKGSVFEKLLNNLKDKNFPNSKIIYVDSPEKIAPEIAKKQDMFGFVPLPDFYLQVKQGGQIKRQPFFDVPHQGYALTFPVGSGWEDVLKEFFAHKSFKPSMNFIIRRHLGTGIDDILWEEESDKADSFGSEEDVTSLQVKVKELGDSHNNLLKFTFISFPICIIALFLYFRYTQKQKKHILVQQENFKKIDEKHNLAINFGKQIQLASFSKHHDVLEVFPESFIHLQPNDLVSGDFYYFADLGNKKVLALMDSAGSGTSAAYITVQGNILFDKIVKEEKNSSPKKIMAELNQRIRASLDNNPEFSQGKGFEMVICTVDSQAQTLTFAGAELSAYLVTEGRLQQLAPNALTIGVKDVSENEITEKTISFKKGTALYLCSNGFENQQNIGGHPYSFERWTKLLEIVAERSMKVQHDDLKQELLHWQGAAPQTDDILVVGVRLA